MTFIWNWGSNSIPPTSLGNTPMPWRCMMHLVVEVYLRDGNLCHKLPPLYGLLSSLDMGQLHCWLMSKKTAWDQFGNQDLDFVFSAKIHSPPPATPKSHNYCSLPTHVTLPAPAYLLQWVPQLWHLSYTDPSLFSQLCSRINSEYGFFERPTRSAHSFID